MYAIRSYYGDSNWLTRIDYSDPTQWRLINLSKDAAQVQAYLLDSTVEADGALTLDAVSDQTIHATVIAGSVALSGGLVGASISGAGAGTDNRVATQVEAFIQGDRSAGGIRAASVLLNASDNATIESLTGAVSVAASGGIVAGAVSIGVRNNFV